MTDLLFLIGSNSDRERVLPALELLEERKLSYELHVFSAHRNLDDLLSFLESREGDFRLVIAAAGLSAALPGIVAAKTRLPVIGVPLVAGELSGIDALLSISQLPKGVPVATMGIGKQGLLNAVLLAERILKMKEA